MSSMRIEPQESAFVFLIKNTGTLSSESIAILFISLFYFSLYTTVVQKVPKAVITRFCLMSKWEHVGKVLVNLSLLPLLKIRETVTCHHKGTDSLCRRTEEI